MKIKNDRKRFVTEYAGLLCMEPVIVLTTIGVSALYDIPTEYMIYLIAVNIVVWLMVLCIQYRFFKKKSKEYQEEIRNLQENHQEENQKWENLREKQDFFALWAHQIKTPIAAMHLLLQSEETDTADCRQELFKIENYVEMALNYLRFEEMSNDLVLEQNSLKRALPDTTDGWIKRPVVWGCIFAKESVRNWDIGSKYFPQKEKEPICVSQCHRRM